MRRTALPLSLAPAVADPAHAEELDDDILAEMQRSHITGVAFAVVKDGKLHREQGDGKDDRIE